MTLHKVTSMNNIAATKLKPFFSKVKTNQENHENRLWHLTTVQLHEDQQPHSTTLINNTKSNLYVPFTDIFQHSAQFEN